MRLRTDDRGVTVQVGTVLLFAVVVVLLSTYQASVVPQQNEQVEFDHSQRVQGQLQDLRDELLRTAVTGSGGSSSIALGTRYPVRAVFVNPAPPSGTLATTPAANVTIRNAAADGEIGDYWTGDGRNFSTRGLTYDPLYHVYQNPPTTVFRNGVLYNRYPNATRTLSAQRLVRGNRISLVALNGSLSESATGSATVDFRAVSAATRTVTVRNETANISVVVPTTLPEENATRLWRQLLEDEIDEDGTNPDRYVRSVESATVEGESAVRIVLENDTYELQMAKVGVGADVSGVDPHYVTDVRGDNASVAEGTSRKLVVEVRDRYNNPVSGARVNFSLDSSDATNGNLTRLGETGETLANLRADAEGQVAVRFEADDVNGGVVEEEVNVSIADVPNGDFAAGAKENVSFDLQIYSIGSGSGEGDGGDGEDGDEGNESTPSVDFRVDDLSHVNENKVRYVASYDVSNRNASFKRVSVVFDALNQGPWATGVSNSTAARGNVRYALGSGAGEDWEVTARVIYENDAGEEYVAASRTITDTADALNPSANDDLSEAGSPSVDSYAVTDRTNSGQGPRYRIEYGITTNENFDEVQGVAISLADGGADAATRTSPNGRIDLSPGYGRGDQFRIKLLVYDADGAVVAVRAETDTAE